MIPPFSVYLIVTIVTYRVYFNSIGPLNTAGIVAGAGLVAAYFATTGLTLGGTAVVGQPALLPGIALITAGLSALNSNSESN